MESIDAFIGLLPKVELHLHLVGSASVPTVLELADRHPDSTVPRSAAEAGCLLRVPGLPALLAGLRRGQQPGARAGRRGELALGAARDLAGQNVRYVELTVTPYTFTSAGMPMAGLTEALDIAARSAGRDHGVRMAYLRRRRRVRRAAAFGTLEHALTCPPEALVGFGLAGIEQLGHASCRSSGQCSLGHRGRAAQRAARGRDVGPGDDLGGAGRLHAERIGHGLSCLDDPALVARLRESQIPLEACPTSNACTRQVPGLKAHPLPRMLEEGLFVTLNSDDPPMFGTTLTDEYRGSLGARAEPRPASRAGRERCGPRSWTPAPSRRCWPRSTPWQPADAGRKAFPRKRPPD